MEKKESGVFKRSDGKFGWRIVAANGKVIANDGGQGYSRRIDAEEMFSRFTYTEPGRAAEVGKDAFRKKPVVIEARQYDGLVIVGHPITTWIRDCGGEYTWTPDSPQRLAIVTLEGNMTVAKGDYVIRGVQGEFYPCKPDIFEATYEPA